MRRSGCFFDVKITFLSVRVLPNGKKQQVCNRDIDIRGVRLMLINVYESFHRFTQKIKLKFEMINTDR